MKFAERKAWTTPAQRIQEISDLEKETTNGYTKTPEDDLMLVERVKLTMPKERFLAGLRYRCLRLKELIYDHKETNKEGDIFCKAMRV